ncbi:MAG: hypothetical protein AB7H88_06180 [Vicinamibacterales bacterium]
MLSVAPSAALICGFVLVHVYGGRLHFLEGTPRSRWLSLAGGISVAYVFVHVLPELGEAQARLAARFGLVPYVEHHAYLVALLGLAAFYGLERMVAVSQRQGAARQAMAARTSETAASQLVFWIHVASFVVYNMLIGYLLVHREDMSATGLASYFVAMALHFLVNDFALREDHQDTYRRVRWLLAAAIVAGWLVGLAVALSAPVVDLLFAFLAGGVLLNVLKEELPEERQSRFWPFAAGAIAYALVLLAI